MLHFELKIWNQKKVLTVKNKQKSIGSLKKTPKNWEILLLIGRKREVLNDLMFWVIRN